MESPYRNPLKYFYQKILIFTLVLEIYILDILVQYNRPKPTPTSIFFGNLLLLVLVV